MSAHKFGLSRVSAKIFLALALLFSAINAIDFIFYGMEFRRILGAIGFVLIAYGAYADGLHSKKGAGSLPANHLSRHVAIAGVTCVLWSFVIKWME